MTLTPDQVLPQTTKYYTGIGSRLTPGPVLILMRYVAAQLSRDGFILRSGGATGADTAFESGVDSNKKEIYLPWKFFNSNPSPLFKVSEEAIEIASRYHPYWKRLNSTTRQLMARNTHQVLGADCRTPSSFVLCWTPDGADRLTTDKTGGTGQAIRIAVAYHIPVFNMANESWHEVFQKFLVNMSNKDM